MSTERESPAELSARFQPPPIPGWAVVAPLLHAGTARQYRPLWGAGSVRVEGDEVVFEAHRTRLAVWLVPIALLIAGAALLSVGLASSMTLLCALSPLPLLSAVPASIALFNRGGHGAGRRSYRFALDKLESLERDELGFHTLSFERPLHDTARVRLAVDDVEALERLLPGAPPSR